VDSIPSTVVVSREISAPANYRIAVALSPSHTLNFSDLCLTDSVMSDVNLKSKISRLYIRVAHEGSVVGTAVHQAG
jgi:hypothetical protein